MSTAAPRTPLTARQAEVYRAILRHVARTGLPPTLRDLMAALGIASTNGVVCHLRPLTAKGYLTGFGANASRSFLPPELLAGVRKLAGKLLKEGV